MVLPDVESVMPALSLQFSPDSSRLYFGRSTACIYSLNLAEDITVGDELRFSEDSGEFPLRQICLSDDSKYLAAIGKCSFIYNVSTKDVSRIPQASTAFTAAAFVRSPTNKQARFYSLE